MSIHALTCFNVILFQWSLLLNHDVPELKNHIDQHQLLQHSQLLACFESERSTTPADLVGRTVVGCRTKKSCCVHYRTHPAWYEIDQHSKSICKLHSITILFVASSGLVDCLPVWSSNYYQIVNRFSNVIRSQFFGHQHKSSFSMFYRFDLESSQFNITSTNVAYIGPSLTSYVGVNPSFRVYLVNSETHEIFNYYTYTLDLKKANLLGPDEEPQFKLLYSAREAYHLKNLRPQSWHRLAMRLENDYKQMNDYLDKTYGGSDSAAYRQSKCTDEECLKKQTCAMVNSVSFNPTFCDYILKLSEADHYDP